MWTKFLDTSTNDEIRLIELRGVGLSTFVGIGNCMRWLHQFQMWLTRATANYSMIGSRQSTTPAWAHHSSMCEYVRDFRKSQETLLAMKLCTSCHRFCSVLNLVKYHSPQAPANMAARHVLTIPKPAPSSSIVKSWLNNFDCQCFILSPLFMQINASTINQVPGHGWNPVFASR